MAFLMNKHNDPKYIFFTAQTCRTCLTCLHAHNARVNNPIITQALDVSLKSQTDANLVPAHQVEKKLCLCGITIKHSNSICLCLFDLSTLTQHKHHI